MSEAQTEFNMDALLDGTLDDLADIPGFEPFRRGTHVAILNIEGPVKVGTHPAFKAKFKLKETVELANKGEEPQAPGAETEILYTMDNEFGQGSFKKLLGWLNESFQKGTNREIIEAAQGAEVLIITDQRSNKDKSVFYTSLKELKVV